jgi:hypothetical protein
MNEGQISDEQVDQLNLHEPVKEARTKFLKLLAAYVKSDPADPELLAKVKEAEVEYEAEFAERLKHVVENPPQPKSIPMKSRTGFKG